VSTCGRGSRLEDAELVALGVRQHHPSHVALPDVDVARSEGEQPLDLSRLVVGPQIEVDAVFDRLGLRDLLKEDVRVIATRLQPPLAVVGSLQGQAERLAPEAGDALGVMAIDHDALPAKGHDPTVADQDGGPAQAADAARSISTGSRLVAVSRPIRPTAVNSTPSRR